MEDINKTVEILNTYREGENPKIKDMVNNREIPKFKSGSLSKLKSYCRDKEVELLVDCSQR